MANKKVILKDNGDNLFPYATLNGIDETNLLASGIVGSYTATEDCVVSQYVASQSGGSYDTCKINDVIIMDLRSSHTYAENLPVYLKKGQVISGYILYVFGIKR